MADLNGDGVRDLITGCFEGGSYVMDGLEDGGFAAPRPVLDAGGGVLRAGQYWDHTASKWANQSAELGIAVAPVDWDGDGDQDLILGTSEGHFHLSRNTGTAEAPAWSSEFETLTDEAGAPLLVEAKHAMPSLGDWDGDGRWDIVSGSNAGGVVWFRNVGEPGAPRFQAAQELVPRSSHIRREGDYWQEPGMRTQTTIGDIDGDGDMDLVVGDYRSRTVDGNPRQREYHGWVWLYRRAGRPQAQAPVDDGGNR